MWVCMCVEEICTQHANNIKKAFRMFEQDFCGVFLVITVVLSRPDQYFILLDTLN